MKRFFSILVALALFFAASPSRADDTSDASAMYQLGLEAAKSQQWGDALASFERSFAIKPHAMTAYNMGIAESALSRLTRARADFAKALELDAKSGRVQLAQSFVDETTGQLRDIEARLVHLHVTLEPSGADVTVDGRPLVQDPTGRTQLIFAGIAASSDAMPKLPDSFEVVVDPGLRDIVIQKEGFAPATSKTTYAAGASADLHLSLTARDATIHVDAERRGAVVRIAGLDVGVTPLTVTRPPGSYSLDVRAPGYETYSTAVQVAPGGRADLFARLPQQHDSFTKKWWFWTGIGAVIVGTAVTVFLLTRPSAPYDGGSSGWVAQAH